MLNALKNRILSAPWSYLPAPVWCVVASPLLSWSMGYPVSLSYPARCSKNPLRLSFWCVKFGS